MTGIQLGHLTGLCDLRFFFAHLSSALCDDFFLLFYYAHSGSEFNWLFALISSPTVVQDTSYVDNALRRILVPRAVFLTFDRSRENLFIRLRRGR